MRVPRQLSGQDVARALRVLGYERGSRTGSGFGVWGQAVTTARFSVSYSFAPFTRNRAPLPRVLTAS